jgi:hypothetical protein
LVFNATFNNISVTLWWSDLTVVDPKYPDATTELELVNSKFNHSCIDYTSLQVAQLSLSYASGYFGSPTVKSDHHKVTEILLKVALNTNNVKLYFKKDHSNALF